MREWMTCVRSLSSVWVRKHVALSADNPATFTPEDDTEQNGVDAEKDRFGRRQLVQHMRAGYVVQCL